MADDGRLGVWQEGGARAVGVGVVVGVLGYATVALVTGIEASASLRTVLQPGALGLYAGALVAGYIDGGDLRRTADTGFRVTFVAATLAQGALFLGVDAPAGFLLLGLMGTAVAYALPATLVGAAGGALRTRLDRDPEVDVDV